MYVRTRASQSTVWAWTNEKRGDVVENADGAPSQFDLSIPSPFFLADQQIS